MRPCTGDLLINFNRDASFVPSALLQAVGYCIGTALLLSLPGACVLMVVSRAVLGDVNQMGGARVQ